MRSDRFAQSLPDYPFRMTIVLLALARLLGGLPHRQFPRQKSKKSSPSGCENFNRGIWGNPKFRD